MAFADLTAPDTLPLLGEAPDLASGRRLGLAAIIAALRHFHFPESAHARRPAN